MARKAKGRRARGTGSVFFHEGRQRWVGRCIVGRTPAGRPIYAERWGATQGEVVRKLALAGPPDPETTTVVAWAVRWRESLTVRPSTRRSYESNLDRYILPALGSMRLAAVNAGHVEALIARLSETLEPGTVRTLVAHLRTMLEAAVRAELISRNPATLAKKPRPTAPEVETYSPTELVRIIEAAAGTANGPIIAALAATGMRVGEALALDIGDWDRTRGTLSISKTYNPRVGVGIGPPKSRHSRRTISVPDVLAVVLAAAAAGRTVGPLFVSNGGQRVPGGTLRRAWKRVLRSERLPYKKPHALRHSVATALIGAGVPLPDVAKFVGDTVQTLVLCYVHATGTNPADALNTLYGVRKVGVAKPELQKPQELKAIAV